MYVQLFHLAFISCRFGRGGCTVMRAGPYVMSMRRRRWESFGQREGVKSAHRIGPWTFGFHDVRKPTRGLEA